jgi:hypothetical protein
VGSSIDQDIEVTFLAIIAMQHRTEYTRIETAIRFHDTAYFFAMRFEGYRGFHCSHPAREPAYGK